MSFTGFPSSGEETFQPGLPGRRDIGKMALGALLAPRKSKAAVHPNAPGIKLCAQSSATPTDEQLLFLKQIGAEYVSVGAPPDMRTAEGFQAIKKRYAEAGITVWNIGNTSLHNMPEVTLNLPGRDRKIEEYKQYIRNLDKAGIYYTTYAHMGNGIWSSGRAMVRGASAREFDMASPNKPECGMGKRGRSRCRTGASSAMKRSGRTSPTSSNRWRRWRRRTVYASASTRTTRRCRCWRACRVASSATSGATSARWRLPAALTWGSACAAGPGWRAAKPDRKSIV